MSRKPSLAAIVRRYMSQVPMVHEHCDRCLACARWGGNAVLMVVDAAFDSIGLNYFQSVVPRVEMFSRIFVRTGKISSLADLASAGDDEIRAIWKNSRSWGVAKEMASHLAALQGKHPLDDRAALIFWAKQAPLQGWQHNPIGRISGVGINTYQYLRMMGGVDTVMPDKIVKKVFFAIFDEAGIQRPPNDIEFVSMAEAIAPQTGYRAIELCWMTWLIQSEAGLSRTEKYRELLPLI